MTQIDFNLKCIAFKACNVAVWTDSSMSLDERKHLSHLIETLADSEEEREALRKIRLDDLNEDQVLAEAAELGDKEKEYVFDKCLDIIASDRILRMQELKFLTALKKICGIVFFAYNRKLYRAQRRAKARVSPAKPILIAVCLLFIVGLPIATFVSYRDNLRNADITLEEKSTGKEILVTIFEPDGKEKPKRQTGQEIFEYVRNGTVSVDMYIKNEPAGGGSGAIIGKDESGMLYVITNRHVVHSEYTEKGKEGDWVRIEVLLPSGARFGAELDFYSRNHDFAILAVKGLDKHARPLELTLKKNLKVGQPIYAIGSPIDLPHTFTAGVISALRDTSIQTDATIHSGSSGGPLVDQYGALCGIVTSGHRAKDYSFALYSDYILKALKERKIISKQQHPPK